MMYTTYKTDNLLTEHNAAYYTNEQGQMISFLFDESNTEYRAYLKWLEEGNEPLPADNEGVA